MDTNTKGDIAEVAVASELTKAGWMILVPQRKAARYDLVADTPDGFKRVQCKWANLKDGAVVIRTRSSALKTDGTQVELGYSSDDVDYIAAYCMELNSCYLVPISEVDGKKSITLRLEPPKTHKSGARYAGDYQITPMGN